MEINWDLGLRRCLIAAIAIGLALFLAAPGSARTLAEIRARGELDAAAVSPATIAYYVLVHPDARLSYVNAYDSEPELRWDLAVGVRRSDDALVAAVNTALDKLIADGSVARIYARYGVQYRRP